jgi:hypothetical protein
MNDASCFGKQYAYSIDTGNVYLLIGFPFVLDTRYMKQNIFIALLGDDL